MKFFWDSEIFWFLILTLENTESKSYIAGGQLNLIWAVEEPGPLRTKENSTSVEPPGRDIERPSLAVSQDLCTR